MVLCCAEKPTHMNVLSIPLISLSSPSGSGKSTVIQGAMAQNSMLELCTSGTTRAPRGNEEHGKDYYFYQPDEFRELIQRDFFLEYEEVYPGVFYGTPSSEIERIAMAGKVPLLDIDVMGALRLKEKYGPYHTAAYLQAMEAMRRERLVLRNTESIEKIEMRMQKSKIEEGMMRQFDRIIPNVLNDQGTFAIEQFLRLVNRVCKRFQITA